METHNALKLESSSDLRRKEVALAQNPLNLVDLAEIAHARLRQAPHQDHIRTRRRDYALAGAMALLAKLPLRSLDLRTGRIGKEFHRDSEGWSVEIETSETGTFINGRLADCLLPYLDATLLMGVGEMHLWTVYEARVGTALFGNPARGWKPFGDNWLWENMRRLTGHGPHIARSLTYDAVVEEGIFFLLARKRENSFASKFAAANHYSFQAGLIRQKLPEISLCPPPFSC